MEQMGVVKKVINGKAEIEVKRISACGENCKSCGGGCDGPKHVVILPNNIGAKAGDLVEIIGETKNILKYTMIVYLIPLTLFILSILISTKILKKVDISNYEPLSFLIGLVFLAVGYFVVKFIDKDLGTKDNNAIRITRII
ncbi:SoxR reducing system RseC family protein [Tissierella sp.]|uniref:SoxR reducing system RseC family protein n=1 Tax=Tissierella sp. TaxID=41274 RepID=UPI002862DA5F|nr:SoxR reducing system RseC family protein [Tissierella sp.]MDR7856420.1 SoxR reducing system RseC family protein [Tissierella sp.]